MIQRISQSFMKSMRKYLAGTECGHIIKHQWVDEKLLESSEEMKLGQYFEYVLGNELLGDGKGAKPKDGSIPEAQYYAKDQESYDAYKEAHDGARMVMPESRMLASYRLAHINARRVRDYFKKMGVKVLFVGKQYTKGRFNGLIDIVAECARSITFTSGLKWKKGSKIIIDVKYSGLLDDQWNAMGWRWTDFQKQHHKVQAIHYHHLTTLPFYYLVVSSKNEVDIAMFYVPVNPVMVDEHVAEANFLHAEFIKAVEIGLIPRPELKRCLECPLKADCADKQEHPDVKTVEV